MPCSSSLSLLSLGSSCLIFVPAYPSSCILLHISATWIILSSCGCQVQLLCQPPPLIRHLSSISHSAAYFCPIFSLPFVLLVSHEISTIHPLLQPDHQSVTNPCLYSLWILSHDHIFCSLSPSQAEFGQWPYIEKALDSILLASQSVHILDKEPGN